MTLCTDLSARLCNLQINKVGPELETLIWVIGAKGLIGSSTKGHLERSPSFSTHHSGSPEWNSLEKTKEFFETEVSSFFEKALVTGKKWSIVWLGGASRVGSTNVQTTKELIIFENFLKVVKTKILENPNLSGGVFFFASSAGALYSGINQAPYDEHSQVIPISEYGKLKLQMEQRLIPFQKATESIVVAGRLSNIYGPGQSLSKSQGLISQLLLGQFYPEKTTKIFVSLETRRDYLYVDDCSKLIIRTIAKAQATPPGFYVKNICSGQHSTISELVGLVKTITKKRTNYVQVNSNETALHSVDMRLTSSVWTEIELENRTLLPVGIANCAADILQQIQKQTI